MPSAPSGAGVVETRVPENGMVAESRHCGTQENGGGTHVEYSTCVAVKLPPPGANVPVTSMEQ